MNAVELAFHNELTTRRSGMTSGRESTTKVLSGQRLRRVLVATEEHSTGVIVSQTLREGGFDVVGQAASPTAIAQLSATCSPDLLIIDDHLRRRELDTKGLPKGPSIPSVLLMPDDVRPIDGPSASDGAAMGAVTAPYSRRNLLPAVEIAYARHLELTRLREEVAKLRLRLDGRAPVERAKKLLMKHNRMSEDQAYRWLQRAAMDHRIAMSAMAAAVVAELAHRG